MEELKGLAIKALESYGSDFEYYEEQFDAMAKRLGLSKDEAMAVWEQAEEEADY